MLRRISPAIRQHISTMTQIPFNAAGRIRRQVYVAVAVALATFLLAISAVGVACRGYEIPTSATPAVPAKPVVADEHNPSRVDGRRADEQLHSAVEAASTEFADAETALAKFVLAHFKELVESKIASAAKTKTSGDSNGSIPVYPLPQPSAPQQPAPAALVENPRWRELNDQLDNLKRRRSEMLETRLPAHPAIRALDASISALESRLGELPQQVPAPNEPATTSVVNQPRNQETPSAPASAAVVPQMAGEIAERWRTAEAEFRKLSGRADSAQRKYRAAVEQEKAAWKSNREIAEKPVTVIAGPPKVRANPKSTILLCGMFSILVGFAAGSGARNPEAVFESAADVRQQLGLTVLGLLPLAPGQQPRERAVSEPHWIGRMVVGSELLLTAIVAVLIVAAVTDRHFFHALLTNPLAACSQKWWC
jgi:hypothetical protein